MSLRVISKKLLLAACVGGLTACAFSPQEDLGVTGQAIVKGKNSDATQDAVVMIFIYDPSSGQAESCTGTLLTSKLVLTARHCVSDTDETAACDVSGAPIAGGTIRSNRPVTQFNIYTGAKSPDFNGLSLPKPAAGVSKIITDGSKNLCNHDVALLALDKEIPNAQIMPIRLDSSVAKGDVITSVGWGVTAVTATPSTRQQRAGVVITAIGPDDLPTGAVSPNEFQVGESICSGDSGGPAIASSGALVGVVSRGGNGTMPSQSNPASACLGTETKNLYTKPDPFKSLIVDAATSLGQEVWIEGQPDPRLAANGGACTADTDCQSAHCLDGKTCAADCSVNACDSGYSCNSSKLCVKNPTTTTTTSGCSASPVGGGPPENTGLIAGVIAFAAVMGARRRRSFRDSVSPL